MGSIYHLFCTVTGKAYVGQTWGALEARWKLHRSPNSNSIKLRNAIMKYGADAFELTALVQGLESQAELDAAEAYWMGFYDCIANGYNIRAAGSHGRNSLETNAKISAALVGNKYNLGHKASPATRLAMSKIRKGRKHSQAHRDALRVVNVAIEDQYGRSYKSLSEAAHVLGLDNGRISRVLAGHLSHTHGFKFKRVEHGR